MKVGRLETLAGWVFILAGLTLAVASVIAVGQARSWNAADAFAADSIRPVRRLGMLLSVFALALLVAATPALAVRTYRSAGFTWTVVGWIGFSIGAALFFMALGLTSIAMPALGELARTGAVAPQQVADRLTHQAPILAAFLGGNLTFLSWVPIGIGLARSGAFPDWLGWVVAGMAVIAWLGFLHVPVVERIGAPCWPITLVVLGLFLVRAAEGA